MKKYLSILVAVMLAALSFTLTSCGDDDDDEPSVNAEIVGTWENLTSQKYGAYSICQLRQDGTYIEYQGETEYADSEIVYGHWSRSGNTLITGTEVMTLESTIIKLTDTEMQLSSFGIVQDFKRVPDSTIDKYL